MPQNELYAFGTGSAPSATEYALRSVWRGFTERTTAHGIPHIRRARGPIKITFWMLVSLICLGLLLYNIYLQTTQYLRHDVKVLIQMKFERNMTFPAVTVCNHNPILKSRLKDSSIGHIIEGYSNRTASSDKEGDSSTGSDTVSRTTNSVRQLRKRGAGLAPDLEAGLGEGDNESRSKRSKGFNHTVDIDTESQTEHGSRKRRQSFVLKLEVMEALADLSLTDKASLGYALDDLVLDCEYSGYQCSVDSDFTSFFNNIYGNCYTYNSGWNKSRDVDLAFRSGPQYGLALVFNIDQDQYVGDLSESVGIRIVVHPQDRMPFPEDEGISISPGQLTYVAISMLTVSRLPKPYGSCQEMVHKNYEDNVFEELYPVRYSTSSCYKTCYQKHVVQRCSCGDPQYPFNGTAFHDATVSACDTANSTQVECVANISSDYQSNRLHCHCPLACSEKSYKISTSAVEWPSDDYKKTLFDSLASTNEKVRLMLNDRLNPTKYKDNLGKVVVYFKELNYELIEETPVYEGGSFLSDIGGILGLYLGFSAITVMEFVELFTDLLVVFGLKIRTLRRPNPPPFQSAIVNNQKTEVQQLPRMASAISRSDVSLRTSYLDYLAYRNNSSPLPGQVE